MASPGIPIVVPAILAPVGREPPPAEFVGSCRLGLLPDVPTIALLRVYRRHVELLVTPVASVDIRAVTLNGRRATDPDAQSGTWRVTVYRHGRGLALSLSVEMNDGGRFQEQIELVLG